MTFPRMTFPRNLLLSGAFGLALAGGVASNDASARQKDDSAQHEGKGHDKGKGHHQGGNRDQARKPASDAGAQHRQDARHRADAQAHARHAQREAQRVAERREAARIDAHRDAARDARRAEAERRADAQRRAAARNAEARRALAHREAAARERDAARHRSALRQAQHDRAQLLALQQRREAEYRRHLADVRAAESRHIAAINAERRARQSRYQQWYWQQQRALQPRWVPRDLDIQRYYAAPVAYRYYRDGRAYEINRYAADLLQRAVRHGYEQGVRAGRADRMDGWQADWRNNHAYQDATYGYGGYFVDPAEYRHYFRQGFRRGYQDAHGDDWRYGRRNEGNDLGMILASVLQSILGLQQY